MSVFVARYNMLSIATRGPHMQWATLRRMRRPSCSNTFRSRSNLSTSIRTIYPYMIGPVTCSGRCCAARGGRPGRTR
eukprot:1365322-Pyramimonas_sp.AAC.1